MAGAAFPRGEHGAARDGRNRYADLLRVTAIAMVVLGHWLLTDITYQNGQLSGLSALPYVSWSAWATLLFQVMPVFFVVGGYANAISWTAHRAEGWTDWVRRRIMRLLWPVTAYIIVAVLAAAAAKAAGAHAAELSQAGWYSALHLWFLPVYLLLIALTPVMLTAHRRWGAAVPVAMAIGAAGVDVIVLALDTPRYGFANYLLVWGCMHQWGFAWRDGGLTRSPVRPAALAVAGIVVLAALLAWGPFPVDMIAAGQRVGNTNPPSVALLAFAAAQTGLLLMLAPAANRLLAHPRLWRTVTRLNTVVINMYLWHMAPVILVAVTLYTTGLVPQPPIATPLWWVLRPAWIALLTALLIPLVWAITWAERPLRLLPSGIGHVHRWSPAILVLGLAAVMAGLTQLAAAGFAPGGQPAVPVLAAYACGLLLALLSGRGSRAGGGGLCG